MNSTSESNSRAWRLIVGVLPIGARRWMAMSSTPFILGNRTYHLDLQGRLEDDQPRFHRGFAAAIEVALRVPF